MLLKLVILLNNLAKYLFPNNSPINAITANDIIAVANAEVRNINPKIIVVYNINNDVVNTKYATTYNNAIAVLDKIKIDDANTIALLTNNNEVIIKNEIKVIIIHAILVNVNANIEANNITLRTNKLEKSIEITNAVNNIEVIILSNVIVNTVAIAKAIAEITAAVTIETIETISKIDNEIIYIENNAITDNATIDVNIPAANNNAVQIIIVAETNKIIAVNTTALSINIEITVKAKNKYAIDSAILAAANIKIDVAKINIEVAKNILAVAKTIFEVAKTIFEVAKTIFEELNKISTNISFIYAKPSLKFIFDISLSTFITG